MRGTAQYRDGRRRGHSLLASVVMTVILGGMFGAAQAESPCISAYVDEPIRFPGGDLRPAGRLTLCDWRSLSPVARMHKTYVNGRAVNLLFAQTRIAEASGEEQPTEMHFHRNDDGHLELLGYVRSLGGRSVTFLFFNHLANNDSIEVNRPARGGDDFLVVMARPH